MNEQHLFILDCGEMVEVQFKYSYFSSSRAVLDLGLWISNLATTSKIIIRDYENWKPSFLLSSQM